MNLSPWSENPPLKQAIDARVLEAPIVSTPYWCAYRGQILQQDALLIQWDASRHLGALNAQGLSALCQFLKETYQDSSQPSYPGQLYLLMQAAGLDNSEPFEASVQLNTLLETLYALTHTQAVQIHGVLQGPIGTYGGASLLLVSVCQNLWCDTPEQLHLVGKPNKTGA